jgi:hypothetical protein
MRQLAYSIRTKHFIDSFDTARENNYINQVYIKNKAWNPPPAPMLVEDKLTIFKKQLKQKKTKARIKTQEIQSKKPILPANGYLKISKKQ